MGSRPPMSRRDPAWTPSPSRLTRPACSTSPRPPADSEGLAAAAAASPAAATSPVGGCVTCRRRASPSRPSSAASELAPSNSPLADATCMSAGRPGSAAASLRPVLPLLAAAPPFWTRRPAPASAAAAAAGDVESGSPRPEMMAAASAAAGRRDGTSECGGACTATAAAAADPGAPAEAVEGRKSSRGRASGGARGQESPGAGRGGLQEEEIPTRSTPATPRGAPSCRRDDTRRQSAREADCWLWCGRRAHVSAWRRSRSAPESPLAGLPGRTAANYKLAAGVALAARAADRSHQTFARSAAACRHAWRKELNGRAAVMPSTAWSWLLHAVFGVTAAKLPF